ncbi:tyrosine-type recombinase/integrase [Myxococcota bacterium]
MIRGIIIHSDKTKTALAPPSNRMALQSPRIASDVSGASSDDHLIDLWLKGRSSGHTRRAYKKDIERFRWTVAKPLRTVTVADLQAFVDSLTGAPSSMCRTLSAVKSLLSFGCKTGYLPFNIGAAVTLPKLHNTLAGRILPETDVHRMLALEPSPRNRALLRLLYAGGLRASEAVGLCWRDLQPRGDAGQVVVLGKGNKVRPVLLSNATWRELMALRESAGPDEPVFRSRTGGPISTTTVYRVVKSAAKRAGIEGNVSPHWLRHCHASHALERGAPISLVKTTLGHASVAVTDRYLHARPDDSSARYLAV